MSVIRTSETGSVLMIELNRPEKLNALNLELKSQLADAIAGASGNERVRTVILTGAGRAFCAGSDVADFQEEPGLEYREKIRLLHRSLIQAITASPKPFIAAVNGPAVGAGFGLALACDLLISTEHAYFQAPVASTLGIAPDFGLTHTLQASVGRNRASSILLFGKRLEAKDALHWGLVDSIVSNDELLEVAADTAHKLAEASPAALAGTKRLLTLGASSDLNRLLDAEADEQSLLRTSETHLRKLRTSQETHRKDR